MCPLLKSSSAGNADRFIGRKACAWATVGGFFGGILLIALIDNPIPETENPHELHTVEEMDG